MVNLDISLIQAIDKELDQILRKVFDNLCSKDLTGIRKNFYERFYQGLQEKFRKELRQIYSRNDEIELLIGEKMLPIENIYTRLVIIGLREQEKQKDMLHSQKLEGGRPVTHEDLFEAKKPIELEKLFE